MVSDVKKGVKTTRYPTSDDTRTLTCRIHGKYEGIVTEINGRKIEAICPECLEDERKSELNKHVEEHMRRKRIDIFNQSCVPKRYQGIKFNDFHPVCDEAEELLELMQRYVKNYHLVLMHGTSFLFSGGTGTGKTTIGTAVLNGVMMIGYTGVYVSSLNLLSKVKRSWVNGATVSQDEIIESYVAYDLLVLDEIGKGQMSAKEKGIIFSLLDRRHEEVKPTIGITTYSEQKIKSLIDEDAVRRLTTGGGCTIKFTWPNYELSRSKF